MIAPKKTKLIAFCIMAILGIPCVVSTLSTRRPVVETGDWSAVVTSSSGEKAPASVYKMWGFPNRLFVELPEEFQEDYHWFAIEDNLVSLVSGVKRFPYRHYNHDKNLGIVLDEANHVKLKDDWSVEWEGKDVQFSNGDFEVSVKRKE